MGNRKQKSSLKRKTLKYRFSILMLVIFLLIITVLTLSNISSYLSLRNYQKTFERYDNLSNLFENIDRMNSNLINFIYQEHPVDLVLYREYFKAADGNLQKLIDIDFRDMTFRYQLLGNMLLTYDEHVEKMLNLGDKANHQQEYESFKRLENLIVDLYPQYSKMETIRLQVEKTRLVSFWKKQLLITLIVFLVMVLSVGTVLISSIRMITRPIEGLVKNINRIKSGDFNPVISEKNQGSDSAEINILLTSFNEMALNLRNYINRIKGYSEIEKRLIEKENENLRISNILTETRLLALQGQMNPHFLFNTLSTLSKLAYIEGAEDTSDLMVRTAGLLRYSLEMSSKISNLDREVQSVKDYFEIQKKRVGDRIRFDIDYREVLNDIRIPGMVLQPIIENSIIHGVQDMVEGAHISLTIRRMNNRVRIIIEDNGAGIPSDIIDEVNSVSGDFSSSNGVGLANMRKRLMLYFRNDFLFHIESEENCGTVVTLDIPSETSGELSLV